MGLVRICALEAHHLSYGIGRFPKDPENVDRLIMAPIRARDRLGYAERFSERLAREWPALYSSTATFRGTLQIGHRSGDRTLAQARLRARVPTATETFG